MIDSVGKIAGTLLAVVLLFFAPMLILAQKQEMIMESYVFAKTADAFHAMYGMYPERICAEIPFAGVLLKKDKDLRTLARNKR